MQFTRNRIIGLIGVVWGGGMVAHHFLGAPVAGNQAYAAGQNFAVLFAAIMFFIGLYYVIKG